METSFTTVRFLKHSVYCRNDSTSLLLSNHYGRIFSMDGFFGNACVQWHDSSPEGPARQIDVSRQRLSPHCLEAIFDSQLPSPKLSPKMPPKLSLPHRRGHFFLFQNYPCGEGNCDTSERQKLSRGNFCPATSICLFWPSGRWRSRSQLMTCVIGGAPMDAAIPCLIP